MNSPKITSLGALKKTDYQPQNIQEELAKKFTSKIK
jgi:hypothetical protein